jgi:hypothetical protein
MCTFDQSTHSIITLLIWTWESMKSTYAIRFNTPTIPMLRIDPQHRCIAVTIFETMLVMIPLHSTETKVDPRLA